MNNGGEYQKKIENKSNGNRVTFANVIHSIRCVCLNKLFILRWHALCTSAINYLNDLPRRFWCAVALWSSDLPLFNDFIQLGTAGIHSWDKKRKTKHINHIKCECKASQQASANIEYRTATFDMTRAYRYMLLHLCLQFTFTIHIHINQFHHALHTKLYTIKIQLHPFKS